MDHLNELDKQVDELEAQIKAWHRESAASCKLEKIPGAYFSDRGRLFQSDRGR
jgi:transposase